MSTKWTSFDAEGEITSDGEFPDDRRPDVANLLYAAEAVSVTVRRSDGSALSPGLAPNFGSPVAKCLKRSVRCERVFGEHLFVATGTCYTDNWDISPSNKSQAGRCPQAPDLARQDQRTALPPAVPSAPCESRHLSRSGCGFSTEAARYPQRGSCFDAAPSSSGRRWSTALADVTPLRQEGRQL